MRKNQSRLCLPCDIHRAAIITTKVFDLVKDDVSGLLSLAVCQRGAGAFSKLQDCLAELITSEGRLHIVRACASSSHLSAEATSYRKALLDLCLPVDVLINDSFRKGSMAANEQRLYYEAVFNGDVRERRVWHFVGPHAPSDEDIKRKLRVFGVRALMPCMLHLFPRHRWTGSQRIFRSTALIAATHHLLREVLLLWLTNSVEVPNENTGTNGKPLLSTTTSSPS